MKILILLMTMILSSSVLASYNKIELSITESDMKKYREKGEKYVFTDAKISVNGGAELSLRLKTRGQTSINAPRRSFSVKAAEKVQLNNYALVGKQEFKSKRFNLVNMWEDKGYVTAQLGYSFFRKFDLFPTPTTYAEVFINGASQGLYMVVESPKEYAKKEIDVDCFIRRGYFKKFEVDVPSEKHPEEQEKCGEAYKNTVRPSRSLKGDDLINYLSERMDLKQYLRWLAINSLLSSGDYSDEVFFYSQQSTTSPTGQFFKVIAWDPDDLFGKPHVTPLSFDNIIMRMQMMLGMKTTLLRSLEIHLERRIDDDAKLYKMFCAELSSLLTEDVTPEFVDDIISEIKEKISPHSTNINVKIMSKLDRLPEEIANTGYTKKYVLNLLETYRNKILKNREELLRRTEEELNK